jgi:hypothetical protein
VRQKWISACQWYYYGGRLGTFSQLELRVESGETSLSWNFGNARLNKGYAIQVNSSEVYGQREQTYFR